MLKVAKSKKSNVKKWILSNMINFKINKKFDTVFCVFDSINHLLKLSDWNKTFKNSFDYLNSNGLFIFDMNTFERFKNITKNPQKPIMKIFKDIIYISEVKSNNSSFDHNEKILKKSSKNNYKLYEETIKEKTFAIEKVKKILNKHFKIIKMTDFEGKKYAEIMHVLDQYLLHNYVVGENLMLGGGLAAQFYNDSFRSSDDYDCIVAQRDFENIAHLISETGIEHERQQYNNNGTSFLSIPLGFNGNFLHGYIIQCLDEMYDLLDYNERIIKNTQITVISQEWIIASKLREIVRKTRGREAIKDIFDLVMTHDFNQAFDENIIKSYFKLTNSSDDFCNLSSVIQLIPLVYNQAKRIMQNSVLSYFPDEEEWTSRADIILNELNSDSNINPETQLRLLLILGTNSTRKSLQKRLNSDDFNSSNLVNQYLSQSEESEQQDVLSHLFDGNYAIAQQIIRR